MVIFPRFHSPNFAFAMLPLAAALLLLPSACGLGGGGDAASPEAIRAELEKGNFGRVRSLVAAAYEAGETTAETRFLAGISDLAIGNGIGAESNFVAARKSGISAKKINPLLAEALARQGKGEAAAALAAKTGDQSAIAIVAGLTAWRTGDSAAAREAFDRAHAIAPNNHRLSLDLAEVNGEVGLFPDALALTAKAIRDEPRNIRAYNFAAHIYMREAKFAEASRAYDAALKILPGNGTALTGKAFALYGTKDWVKTDKFLASLPQNIAAREDIQLLRGKIAARRKRYDEARTLFSDSGEMLYQDDEAVFLIGQVFSHQGQQFKAVRMMEAAVRARPDLAEYHAGLITAYRAVGDNAAAAKRIAAIPENLRAAPELQGL